MLMDTTYVTCRQRYHFISGMGTYCHCQGVEILILNGTQEYGGDVRGKVSECSMRGCLWGMVRGVRWAFGGNWWYSLFRWAFGGIQVGI